MYEYDQNLSNSDFHNIHTNSQTKRFSQYLRSKLPQRRPSLKPAFADPTQLGNHSSSPCFASKYTFRQPVETHDDLSFWRRIDSHDRAGTVNRQIRPLISSTFAVCVPTFRKSPSRPCLLKSFYIVFILSIYCKLRVSFPRITGNHVAVLVHICRIDYNGSADATFGTYIFKNSQSI